MLAQFHLPVLQLVKNHKADLSMAFVIFYQEENPILKGSDINSVIKQLIWFDIAFDYYL